MDARNRRYAYQVLGIFGLMLVVIAVPIWLLGSTMTAFAVVLVLVVVVLIIAAAAGRRWRIAE